MWFLFDERTRRIPLIFAAVGIMSIAGAIWRVVAETGQLSASVVCMILVYLGFWPFFVLSPFLSDHTLGSSSNVCISVLGWLLLGVVVAEVKARLNVHSGSRGLLSRREK
jgi:hypothetical protein